jgi:hypothetical protein
VTNRVVGLLALLCGAALLAGCANGAATRLGVGNSVSPTTNAASSPSWHNFGHTVTSERSQERSLVKAGSSPVPGANIPTFGPYLSLPIDVTGNGTYALLVGPIPTGTNLKGAINAISFPPDTRSYFTASVLPSVVPTTETIGSHTYVSLNLIVSHFIQSYVGFSVWVQ